MCYWYRKDYVSLICSFAHSTDRPIICCYRSNPNSHIIEQTAAQVAAQRSECAPPTHHQRIREAGRISKTRTQSSLDESITGHTVWCMTIHARLYHDCTMDEHPVCMMHEKPSLRCELKVGDKPWSSRSYLIRFGLVRARPARLENCKPVRTMSRQSCATGCSLPQHENHPELDSTTRPNSPAVKPPSQPFQLFRPSASKISRVQLGSTALHTSPVRPNAESGPMPECRTLHLRSSTIDTRPASTIDPPPNPGQDPANDRPDPGHNQQVLPEVRTDQGFLFFLHTILSIHPNPAETRPARRSTVLSPKVPGGRVETAP